MKDYIVIHHSLTADGQTVSWGAIRKYHVEHNGWSAIGYHWGIELVGDAYEILAGRMSHEAGAHTKEAGMNRRGIGVCLVGNFDLAPPTEGQLAEAVRLVDWLQRTYNIPRERVIGHREAGLMAGFDWRIPGQYKSCPGRLVDMDAFRERVRI